MAGLGKVGIDGWPIIIVGGHDAAQVFEGCDGFKGGSMDGNGCRLSCLAGAES